jgi:acyl-coenzyme A thioesterase PaaI-like protein
VADIALLRSGRTLVFAEIRLGDGDGRLAGHATASYMLLPRASAPGGGR